MCASPNAPPFCALPEGQRGIFVGGGGSVRVPRLIGVSRMADMMLTGRAYSAEEGVALGFLQYQVEEAPATPGLAPHAAVRAPSASTPPSPKSSPRWPAARPARRCESRG